jgi:hypothetical protein
MASRARYRESVPVVRVSLGTAEVAGEVTEDLGDRPESNERAFDSGRARGAAWKPARVLRFGLARAASSVARATSPDAASPSAYSSGNTVSRP